MLLQSQHGCIEVLPALPTAWANGSFSGLKALGGAEVSAEWKEGAVEWMTVKATHEGDFRIKLPRKDASPLSLLVNQKAISLPVVDGTITVSLKVGDILTVQY